MKKAVLPIILPLVGLVASCSRPSEMYAGQNAGLVFHSFFSWRFDSTSGDYGKDIADLTSKLSALTDPYKVPEEGLVSLYTVNQSSTWVEVDPMLYEILELSFDLKEKTEGYFNPFIGEISRHWKETLFGIDIPLLDDPTAEDIALAKQKVPAMLERMNQSSLEFDPVKKAVKRNGEGVLDLGGLVKGFAVNKVKELVKSRGAERYLINGGQSSLAIGKTKDYGPYKVSLQYTMLPKEYTYSLENVDCSTSAIYEQKVEVYESPNSTKVYSHVLNPKTGMPETKYSMAFLVGNDSALLDAMSTSVMLADLETTKRWASQYGFEYAIFYNAVYGKAKLKAQSPGLEARQIEMNQNENA